MKKVVVKLDLHDQKAKQKAMKAVSRLSGIDSISIDMKEKKLSVVGNVDPVQIVTKLRKAWRTEIVSVGEAKKEEPKKAESKKEEPKKEEKKREEKKREAKKEPSEQVAELLGVYPGYNPQITVHYPVQSVEEEPNIACVIC